MDHLSRLLYQQYELQLGLNVKRKNPKSQSVHEDQGVVVGQLLDKHQTDQKTKSQMRRARIKMLFEDFQSEISYLESHISDINAENNKLRGENDELHSQIKDLETRYLTSLKRSADELERERVQNSRGDSPNDDIHTILKLSSKLQEVMGVNETMAQSNTQLKQEIKSLRHGKEQQMLEIKSLRDQQKLIDSPQRYDRYTIVALQTKVGNYEIEIEQLKKALKKSDQYIEKLSLEIDTYKQCASRRLLASPTYGVTNVMDSNVEVNGTNDLDLGSRSSIKDASKSSSTLQGHHHQYHHQIVKNDSRSSASATLQSLVRQKGTTSSSCHRGDKQNYLTIWNPNSHQSPPKAEFGSDNINNNVERSVCRQQQQQQQDKVDDIIKDQRAKKTDQAVISNPLRFPACIKLLELSKQRGSLSPPAHSSASEESKLTNSSSPSPSAISPSPRQQNVFNSSIMGHSIPSSSSLSTPVVQYHICSQQSTPTATKNNAFTPPSPSVNPSNEQQQRLDHENDVENITISNNSDGAESDKITIAMSSEEQSPLPWLQQVTITNNKNNAKQRNSPQSISPSHQTTFSNTVSTATSWSKSLSPASTRFYNGDSTSRTYSPYYTPSPYASPSLTSREHSFRPPLKKIKTEVLYE